MVIPNMVMKFQHFDIYGHFFAILELLSAHAGRTGGKWLCWIILIMWSKFQILKFEQRLLFSLSRWLFQYIRLAEDTDPKLILNLLMKHWNLPRPKLVISVAGGRKNLGLSHEDRKNFNTALKKVLYIVKTMAHHYYYLSAVLGLMRNPSARLVLSSETREILCVMITNIIFPFYSLEL